MSRKFLVTIILILFILPFVSWYYLQRGLDWRKEAQKIMNGTDPFPEGRWEEPGGKTFSDTHLEDHVSLITFMPCDQSEEVIATLNKFYDQFKDTKKANFIILDSCAAVSAPDRTKQGWYVFPCSDSMNLCNLLAGSWPQGKTHALVDRDKKIRSYYSSSTVDEKRLLLEHMALLLPRERSEKVELKRGNE